MDWQMLGQWISQYGFPMVACVAMFWMLWKTNQQHREESEKWVEALNNNTRILERLEDKLS